MNLGSFIVTAFTEDSVISKLMFDEVNSLCTTSNLPLLVRVATGGLLSATEPSAEAMLGYACERVKETLKRFSKQCCSCYHTAQLLQKHQGACKAVAKGQDSLYY